MARLVLEFQSKYLLRKSEIVLFVPSMNLGETIKEQSLTPYQDKQKKYPLMILLGGFGESKYAWESHSNIEDLAEKYGLCLAMIGGENKWYLNYSPIDAWESYINYELPDFLFGNFSCFNKQKYICGCSMGGYGALHNYLLYKDSYEGCIALSPATRPDNKELEQSLGTKSLHELVADLKDDNTNVYLSIGTKDFIYKDSVLFNDYLLECNKGISYKFKEGFGHNWELWQQEIEAALKEILKINN